MVLKVLIICLKDGVVTQLSGHASEQSLPFHTAIAIAALTKLIFVIATIIIDLDVAGLRLRFHRTPPETLYLD